MKLPISVIVLTYNEEKNIIPCLESVADDFQNLFIVDSFSTDNTLKIVEKFTDKVFEHEFENYGKQRNWALNNLPIKTRWVLNLNADQRITDILKAELIQLFSCGESDKYDGFLISRKTMFMNKWIKHGCHYPVYDAILFKQGCGVCEESRYDQVFVIKGKSKVLKGDVIDIVTDSLSNFVLRHNKWASQEAIDQVLCEDHVSNKKGVKQNYWGNPMERRRYLKASYMKFPLFLRAFIYYLYRYFIRLGFLDGIEGLIFHFLQGFWFRFLVDAKIYEMNEKKKYKSLEVIIEENQSVKL